MANADGPLGDRTLPMLITALSRVTKNNMCTSSKIGMGRRFAEAGVSPASAAQVRGKRRTVCGSLTGTMSHPS